MLADWTLLSEQTQLLLSQEALLRAADIVVAHAELLAEEMERGSLADRGGPDALRLLAAIVRAVGEEHAPEAGHA
jgi:hypothetical protein